MTETLKENPLQTDEELARRLGVSVPTIRLDRMRLGIPELRQRTQGLALRAVRPGRTEGMGLEIADHEAGRWVAAVWRVEDVFGVGWGEAIPNAEVFRQADALVRVVTRGQGDAALAHAQFRRPVRTGERLALHAEVIRRQPGRLVVLVVFRAEAGIAFRAKFVVGSKARTYR